MNTKAFLLYSFVLSAKIVVRVFCCFILGFLADKYFLPHPLGKIIGIIIGVVWAGYVTLKYRDKLLNDID